MKNEDFTYNEYELMYFNNEWNTFDKIVVTNDEFAIDLADEEFNTRQCLKKWQYGVALWRIKPTKELLKTYIEAKAMPSSEKIKKPINTRYIWATVRIGYKCEEKCSDYDAVELLLKDKEGAFENGILLDELYISEIINNVCID